MTLLADLVAASSDVAASSARTRKVAILAALLEQLDASEIPIAVGFLSGVPRQGRVGVGYSTIYGIEHGQAAIPSLTIVGLDRTITELQALAGGGSGALRKQILTEILGRATEEEADFVKRLFTGELRQGALGGVMADAVAKAAGVSGELTRRALMLSGDLTRTAEVALTAGEEGLRAVGFEVFRPVLPMLAATADNVEDAVAAFAQASVEWKLWSNAPQTTGSAVTTTSGSGYREWAVAGLVQAMYSTGQNHGFLVRDASEDQDAEQQFHAREKGETVPQLVLTFKPA